MESNTLTLLELNTQLKRIIALNFQQPIWITAEIAQVSVRGGHRYIHLIQKDRDSDIVQAQMNSVIWGADFEFILKSLGSEAEQILKPGMQVRILGSPNFHERFGLQFRISNLDINFTRGALDLKNELLLRRLQEEGLIQKNKSLPLPIAFKRLAVISSPNAAGWKDFLRHLEENIWGYKFDLQLYDNIMQGDRVKSEMLQNLDNIYLKSDSYDAIIIIRGGGSKIDLSDFNDYEICRKISESPLPVLTGIGHEIDISATDMVAAIMLKTPTAVASYLIDSNLNFLQSLGQLLAEIENLSSRIVTNNFQQLKTVELRVKHAGSKLLNGGNNKLNLLYSGVQASSNNFIKKWYYNLTLLYQGILNRDPRRILELGYTLLIQQEKPVTSLAQFNATQKFELIFKDGTIEIYPAKE